MSGSTGFIVLERSNESAVIGPGGGRNSSDSTKLGGDVFV